MIVSLIAFATSTVSWSTRGRCISPRRGVCSLRASTASVPLEHRDVPDGHRGLHDTLYSKEDEHADRWKGVKIHLPSPGETMPARELADTLGAPRAAVYAVIDSQTRTRYVGLTRDLVRTVRGHAHEFGFETIWRIRVHAFDFPRRSEMLRVRDEWLADLDAVPAGNIDSLERERWEGRKKLLDARTKEEKDEYEEKKFKLRKAMANSTLMDELEAVDSSEGSEARRQKLRAAVEQEDWSGEVQTQTKETVDTRRFRHVVGVEEGAGVSTTDSSIPIESPFLRQREDVTVSSELLELNLKNVDVVLDEVRPLLVADGGNITALSVLPMSLVGSDEHPPNTFRVTVQLEGACGTCPSSTMTMKHGVERKLRERFGNALGEVIAVADPAAGIKSVLTVKACDLVLDDVRPILNSLPQCRVRTLSVEGGAIRLDYSGPDTLRYAIELMLREKLPDVQSIDFVTSDEASVV